MPKLKTHKGTKKRVRVTRKGKILRERAFGGHFLEKKSSSRKRVIATSGEIKGSIARGVKRALGVK